MSSSKKNPNPQGKGQVVLLKDLEAQELEIPIQAKSAQEVSDDLFTALFILHSDCAFQAKAGQTYHLYRLEGRYKLLLIPPEGWYSGPPGDHWASCRFHEDLTWSLELSEKAQNCESFQNEVKQARVDFENQLEKSEQLEDALPYFSQNLDYHQRVLAYGLAKSLQTSMDLEGISKLTYREALHQLEG